MIWALGIGLWNTLAMLLIWWLAALNHWTVRINFNALGEGMAEGFLLHICLGVTAWALFREWKRWVVRHAGP